MRDQTIFEIVMNAYAAGRADGRAEVEVVLNPKQDIISRNKAERMFGREWMERNIVEGRIRAHRSSFKRNAKYYLSLSEIQRVYRAEAICEIVVKERNNINNTKKK